MTKWDMWRKTCLAHAQLKSFERLVESAQALLTDFFARTERPYIAYSGGKDSQAMLDLALNLKPDVMVAWEDEEWIYPSTLNVLDATDAHYGLSIHRLRYEGKIKTYFAEFGDYHSPEILRPYLVYRDPQHFLDVHHLDGYALGIRVEESDTRRKRIGSAGPIGLNKTLGIAYIYPLHQWSTRDVWAYIFSRGLPYNDMYEWLINANVEPLYARVGSLCVAEVYQFGTLAVIKRRWPGLWAEFTQRNPEAQPYG